MEENFRRKIESYRYNYGSPKLENYLKRIEKQQAPSATGIPLPTERVTRLRMT
jgi:hypothetical protein